MPTKEELLREKTFKDDVSELEKRIFYTLTSDKKLQNHRVATALSLLIKHLHDKGIASDEDIDDLLYECV